MSIKEVLNKHKMHKEMNVYLQGLSNELVEDYSMLYSSDFTKAKDSQKYAKILFYLIEESKKSNNTKAYAELKNIVDSYGKWKRVTNCGQSANAPAKICLSLPTTVQAKLETIYRSKKSSRATKNELNR